MSKPIYIASGSYGCVIKPGYICKKEENIKKKKKSKIIANTVSKLFPKKKEWLREINLHEIVQKEIDPDNKFTIKLIDSCEIVPSILKSTQKIEKCKLVNQYQKENIYQIIYENGGIDLYNIIIKRTYPDISERFNIINALHSFISIFEGLKILAIKNYIHHDIKLDNILYDINKNKFILIDFGLLRNISKTFDYVAFLFKDPHNLTFKYYPPEYNIMYFAYLNKKTLNRDDIQDINLYDFNSSFIPLLKKAIYIYNIPNKYKEKFKKIIETLEYYIYIKSNEVLEIFKDASEYKLKPTEEDIDKYIKELSNIHSYNQIDIRNKIDTYMLGLYLLTFILHSFIYLNETNNIFKIPIKFFDLLLKMIDINPFTRINIDDATEEYKRIFHL